MSDSKTLARAIAAASLVNLLALGTASAATLNHRHAPAAAASDASATAARPAVNAGSTSLGAPGRNCTRGHLSHGRC